MRLMWAVQNYSTDRYCAMWWWYIWSHICVFQVLPWCIFRTQMSWMLGIILKLGQNATWHLRFWMTPFKQIVLSLTNESISGPLDSCCGKLLEEQLVLVRISLHLLNILNMVRKYLYLLNMELHAMVGKWSC